MTKIIASCSNHECRVGGVAIESMGDSSGLGLACQRDVPNGSVVVTVPSSVALSVESPGEGPDDRGVFDLLTDRRAFRELPWFVQFSCYLNKLDKVSPSKLDIDYKTWLDSLPRAFDTPIHWNKGELADRIQYQHLTESVQRQEESWQTLFKNLQDCMDSSKSPMDWDDFLWGMECARSVSYTHLTLPTKA